jgi:hypothetical protein
VKEVRARVLALIPNPDLRSPVEEATGRWAWAGAVDVQGDGIVGTGRHGALRARRLAYERRYGPLPPGPRLDHRRRNRRRVNPEPLEPVADAEHRRRGARAKLTRAAVCLIRQRRARERIPHARPAATVGVSTRTFGEVLNGRRWREEGLP